MGLRQGYLDYIEVCVRATLGELAGLRMLELGNQEVRGKRIPEKTGKAYYTNRGVAHTSFDLNGEDGALAVDLAEPVDEPEWLGAFDIITNSGTTEHVEPFEAQYTCFRNIHNWLRPGGVVVHLVPDIDELEQRGLWRNHCNNYYSHDFFAELARLNGYRLLSSKVIGGLRCAGLQKQGEAPFTAEREALLAKIARREGGIVYAGINDQALTASDREAAARRVRTEGRPLSLLRRLLDLIGFGPTGR